MPYDGRKRGRRGQGRGRGRGHFRGGGNVHKTHFGGDIQEQILNFLQENSPRPVSAFNIARGCGYHSPKDVNPTLYALKRRRIVVMQEGKPPLWLMGEIVDVNDDQNVSNGFSMNSMGDGNEDMHTGIEANAPLGQTSSGFEFGRGLVGFSGRSFVDENQHGGFGITIENFDQSCAGYGRGLPAFSEMTVANVMTAKPSGSYVPMGQSHPQTDMKGYDSYGASASFRQETVAGPSHQEIAGDKVLDQDVKTEDAGVEAEKNVDEDVEDDDWGSYGDEDEMEEEFDINDRISDLMAYGKSSMFEESFPSESGSQSQGEESTSQENCPGSQSNSPMAVGDLEFSLKDKVLVTLSERLLKTATAFVLKDKLNCSLQDVEEVLQDLEKDKFVGKTGSAWTVINAGDEYLTQRGLIGPSKEIVASQRKGDQNIYHESRRGGAHGVPLNPLELMGSNTKFGLRSIGRGAILAKITEDISNVTNPAKREQVSLTSLTSDSIIGVRGQGHGRQTSADLIAKPGGFSSQTVQQFQNQMSAVVQQSSFSVTSQAKPSALPLSPMEMIQRERSQDIPQPQVHTGMMSSAGSHSYLPSAGSQSFMSPPGTNSLMPSSTQQSMPNMAQGVPQSLPNMAQSGPVSLSSMTTSLSSLPLSSLEITSESFAGVNKNPVSALMEYAQSRGTAARIEVISSRGPSHKPKFVLAAFVGTRQFPGVECGNKKDGKKEAADVAMRILLAEGHKAGNMGKSSDKPQVPVANMTHFDKMAALCHQAFNQLIASIPETFAGRKIIAGLVLKRNPDDLGIVISIGSGNRCITGQQMSLEGTTVNDCHAEIITRRGFIRFLYRQLEAYEPGKPHDLFEAGSSGKLRIKPGNTFHLYISTAPCGDGALFSPRDSESNKAEVKFDRQHHPTFTSAVQGLLRTKMEGGEGTIPIESDFVAQTFDGIQRGERLRTMSCTDKICRWNVVGMQGALLSHFLEPVYLDSLTLGFLYDHGHLARAICCRVNQSDPPIDSQLPQGFHLNHPWLGRVTACDALRETQKTKSLSVNWSLGDSRPEVLDGPLGLCHTGIEKTFFSRLCKKNLYESFHKVAAKFGRQDLLSAENYNKAKMMAKDFQSARTAMVKRFRETKLGPWVSKPVEEEMFS